MRTFGLIGYPLSHSFSKKYFTAKFNQENIKDCVFENFSIEYLHTLPDLLINTPSLSGLSVTIPHKKNVMRLLTSIDSSAKIIGAVNCIRIQNLLGKKILTGYNTDVYGFEESLKPLLKKHHQKALILGTGGASNAIVFCLDKLGISFQLVSRRKDLLKNYISYTELSEKIISDSLLIINTTPLGTFPNINECPSIPYSYLSTNHLLYDLTYNPEETLFLKRGKEKGAETKNGYDMLCIQAEKAWKIWNL